MRARIGCSRAAIASGETLTDLGTLTNIGTLTGGGKLVIDPATFTNSGYNSVEVALDAGSYLDNTNTGTINVAGTAVYGYGGPVSVVNAGTIEATGTGGIAVYLKAGGSVDNTGTIINAGSGPDILLASGGYAHNEGVLVAGTQSTGIVVGVGANGTVVNSGNITALGTPSYGVRLGGGGAVTNTTTGYIQGGILVDGAGSVGNAGSIGSAASAPNGTSPSTPPPSPDPPPNAPRGADANARSKPRPTRYGCVRNWQEHQSPLGAASVPTYRHIICRKRSWSPLALSARAACGASSARSIAVVVRTAVPFGSARKLISSAVPARSQIAWFSR